MGGAVVKPQDAKSHGNTAFERGEFHDSAIWYTRALAACYEDSEGQNSELLASLHSNRSAVYMALGTPDAALADAQEAKRLRPRWEKAHYREAMAYSAMSRHDESRTAMAKALALAPGNF